MFGRHSKDHKAVDNAVQHWGWWLLGIFLVAMLIRCYAVTFYPAQPVADAADYHALATRLVQGQGYVNEMGAPTAWRPPGYPFFLAGIYKIFGLSIRAATLLQAGLGALTVVLLMIFGKMVLGERQAIAGGVLAALYPGLFWLPRVLLSEGLSLLLVLAALIAVAKLMRTNQLWWAALCGILLGLGTLVRAANLLVAVALLLGFMLFAWKCGWRWQRIVMSVLLIAGATSAVLLPWTARNYRLFHRPLLATQDGMTLYSSYWPPQRGGKLIFGNLAGDDDPIWVAAKQAGDEAMVSKQMQAITFERLRQHPGYFFRLLPSKFLSLMVPYDWEWFPHAAGSSRSLNPVYVLILLAAILGLFLPQGRTQQSWLLWVLPLFVFVQTLLFYGSPRFRLPAETSAILWASVGLVWIWDYLIRARGREI